MTEKPIKVLQVIDTLGMGGAETWLMELLRLWSRSRAVQMDFLLTSGNRGIFDDEARELGAQLHYLPYGRAHLPRFASQFRRLLRNQHYDAIHDHQDYASGWHFVMGLGALPPVRVSHVHNPWIHIGTNYAVSVSRRLTAEIGKALVRRLATDVTGTSAEVLRRYGFEPGQVRRPRVSVVHCGVDIAKFNAPRGPDRQSVLQEFAWPSDAKVALFAGRLDRGLEFDHPQNHKNSWFALNVVREAARKDPAVRFLMAGAGQARQELERSVEAWGLGDRIRLIGVRRDMPRLVRAADALLFPSRQEGLGMAAVESQTAGLPVLASTAVPREAVVVPELFKALSLSEPLGRWADTLIETMAAPRMPLESCRQAVEASAFSIAHSAHSLLHIYGGSSCLRAG